MHANVKEIISNYVCCISWQVLAKEKDSKEDSAKVKDEGAGPHDLPKHL